MAALAKYRALQPIGHKSLNFLSKNAWDLANCFVKRDGVGNSAWLGLFPRNDLYQRDQMWRVKRMANQKTAGIFHLEGLFGSRLRGTGREEQRVRRDVLLDAGP